MNSMVRTLAEERGCTIAGTTTCSRTELVPAAKLERQRSALRASCWKSSSEGFGRGWKDEWVV